MKAISSIFLTLFGLYCLLVFTVSLLLVIPLYLIIFNLYSASKAPALAHKVSRYWATVLFFFFGIRFRCGNRQYIDPSQTYIFISNHRSMLDIPAYALSCPHTFRFLSKEELTKIPLLGYVIRKLYITVKRSDKHDRKKSIEKMLISLRQGISVFLAPEGTRNTGNEPLLNFKDGAFRLAIAAQMPLAVLVLYNSADRLSPLRPLQLSPGLLEGEWLPVMDTRGLKEEDVQLLKSKVEDEMKRCLLEYKKHQS